MLRSTGYAEDECVLWRDLSLYSQDGRICLRVLLRFVKGEK